MDRGAPVSSDGADEALRASLGMEAADGRRRENDFRGGCTVTNESDSSSYGGAVGGRLVENDDDPNGIVLAASHKSPSGTIISTDGFG